MSASGSSPDGRPGGGVERQLGMVLELFLEDLERFVLDADLHALGVFDTAHDDVELGGRSAGDAERRGQEARISLRMAGHGTVRALAHGRRLRTAATPATIEWIIRLALLALAVAAVWTVFGDDIAQLFRR